MTAMGKLKIGIVVSSGLLLTVPLRFFLTSNAAYPRVVTGDRNARR